MSQGLNVAVVKRHSRRNIWWMFHAGQPCGRFVGERMIKAPIRRRQVL
jgi:hypothetical protein